MVHKNSIVKIPRDIVKQIINILIKVKLNNSFHFIKKLINENLLMKNKIAIIVISSMIHNLRVQK